MLQKPDEIKKIVLDLFYESKTRKTPTVETSKSISLGRLTPAAKNYLSEISGLDFREFADFMLNVSDLRHIYKEHYGENEKDQQNNTPLTDEDIQEIPFIIARPDQVLFLGYDERKQTNKFAFLKKNSQGTYGLMEVYGNKGGKLTVKTFYNSKRDINKLSNLLSTSRNAFGVLDQRVMQLSLEIPQMIDGIYDCKVTKKN